MEKIKQPYFIIFYFVVLIFLSGILIRYTFYQYAGICLLGAGLSISIIPLLKSYNSKYDTLINYLKTIIGTLLGVFFAIYFSQLNKGLNILQSTKNDIYSCMVETKFIINSVTDTNGINSYKRIQFYFRYKPNTLIDILKMESVHSASLIYRVKN